MHAARWALGLTLAAWVGACSDAAEPIGSPHARPTRTDNTASTSSTDTASTATVTQGVFSCACVAATASQGCANCYNEAIASGNACAARALKCQDSAACRSAFVCLNQCEFAAACIPDCLAIAKAGQGLPLLEALFACTCGACADACSVNSDVGCDDGAGGAGGAPP